MKSLRRPRRVRWNSLKSPIFGLETYRSDRERNGLGRRLAQVRELLALWRLKSPISIADALKLLGPQRAFQHDVVRAFAVDALSSTPISLSHSVAAFF